MILGKRLDNVHLILLESIGTVAASGYRASMELRLSPDELQSLGALTARGEGVFERKGGSCEKTGREHP